MVSAGWASVFPQLNCIHEEADDKMTFHVQDILSRGSGSTSMTLLSGDTDVFVCLLYPFTVSWRDLGLQELWLICNSSIKRVILPLHDICSELENDLIKCLPAVHALTGCDTTSKIATKSAALNAVQKLGSSSLVLDFSSPQLTESSVQNAGWSDVSNRLQIWRHLIPYILLYSIAMPWSWTLKELLAPQLMQGSIFIEHTIKYSCGFKHH